MVPLFSVSDSLRKANNFLNQSPFKIIDFFLHQLIWPNLLYLGNPEDFRNGVGDFFAQKVMQIPKMETVFESEQIWNFLYNATP